MCPKWDTPTVSKVDSVANTVRATVNVGFTNPTLGFDGTNIMVGAGTGGQFVKIDSATSEVRGDVGVVAWTRGMTFDGTHLWVAMWSNNTVLRIPAS